MNAELALAYYFCGFISGIAVLVCLAATRLSSQITHRQEDELERAALEQERARLYHRM